MPTKRTRRTRNMRQEISNTALYYATDGLWGELNEESLFEKFTYGFPTVRRDECRQIWLSIRDEFLPEWIKQNPGTRPSWWYLFDPDCPRVSEEDIKRHGWEGWFFLSDIPDLRRRLGGVGDPIYEHLSHVPRFDRGVPVDFVSASDVKYYRREGESFDGKPIDPNDPPRYESEATWLKRHGLLTRGEKRQLTRNDFEPETVEENEEEDGEDVQMSIPHDI